MRSSKGILKKIANVSVTVGFGAVTLLGRAAYADTTVQQRAEAEMNKGLDYAAAWQVASRAVAPVYLPRLSAGARRAEAAMNQGKDYAAAWEATSVRTGCFSEEQIAKAQLAREQMNEGKDYIAAWEASASAEPATLRVARSAVATAAHDRACSVK